MFQRFAIYYAPERGSALDLCATAWLAQPELEGLTVSARRYGFHATIKAPMRLNGGREGLEAALRQFAGACRPVPLGILRPQLIDGFLALTVEPQPVRLTDFAAKVVGAFEPWRAPLDAGERARRLAAALSPRQRELVDLYGYPYVLEEFQFHMTLTDRLPAEHREPLLAAASAWFETPLRDVAVLDRLVLFAEPEAADAFVRLADFVLKG